VAAPAGRRCGTFFFRAEDGIRDGHVTGVQTCALPILAATVVISSALGGTLGEAIPGIALMAAAGVGMIASGAFRLPRWARLRERQMEDLAARVALPPRGNLPSTFPSGRLRDDSSIQ